MSICDLPNLKDLHEHPGIICHMRPDRMEAPEMHPGVAGTLRQTRLHHPRPAEQHHDEDERKSPCAGVS